MKAMAGIVPHGSECIPDLAGDMLHQFEPTRNAYLEIEKAVVLFTTYLLEIYVPYLFSSLLDTRFLPLV